MVRGSITGAEMPGAASRSAAALHTPTIDDVPPSVMSRPSRTTAACPKGSRYSSSGAGAFSLYIILSCRMTTGLSLRMAVFNSPFASQAKEGSATFSPGICATSAAQAAAISIDRAGEIVLALTRTAPGSIAASAPSSTAPRSAASSASIENTTPAPIAAAAGVAARVAPCATSRSALPAERFQTVRSCPAARRCRAMGSPILPRPIQPMRAMGHSSHVLPKRGFRVSTPSG